MDFDVSKRVNGVHIFSTRIIGGFCVKSQFILENFNFLSITKQKFIIGPNELGSLNKSIKKCFGSNFREKKCFVPKKKFGPFSKRK